MLQIWIWWCGNAWWNISTQRLWLIRWCFFFLFSLAIFLAILFCFIPFSLSVKSNSRDFVKKSFLSFQISFHFDFWEKVETNSSVTCDGNGVGAQTIPHVTFPFPPYNVSFLLIRGDNLRVTWVHIFHCSNSVVIRGSCCNAIPDIQQIFCILEHFFKSFSWNHLLRFKLLERNR